MPRSIIPHIGRPFLRLIFAPAIVFGSLANTASAVDPASTRIANYSMRARLDPTTKTVEGSYELTWTNTSTDTVRELRFHLYLNAFRDAKSTLMKESGGRHRSDFGRMNSEDWGYTQVRSLKIIDGEDLTPKIEFISPDDGNPDDRTVIRVPLTTSLRPGRSVILSCEFLSKLPRLMERTGFGEDDFFMVAQWYPKIGVWQNGAWNCHQFHALSEFFADFGVYDMVLTAPNEYVVVANAGLVSQSTLDSMTQWVYRQEDVIDAVWVASPHLTLDSHRVEMEPPERTFPAKTIDIVYAFAPGREVMKERYDEVVQKAFDYFHSWVGEYPYSRMTILDVPMGEEFTAGGMEYPTLVTTGSFFGSEFTTSMSGLRMLEIVTFHELAHNYFQSVVATNEFEEPWLDEGMTTYLEHRSLQKYFRDKRQGEYIDAAGLRVQSLDYHRSSYVPRPRDGTIVGKSWEFTPGFYQTAVYSKPALLLSSLERLVGEDTMNRILRTYFERWKFRHPTTADFVSTVQEVSGKDLSWFFDQFLFSNKTVDYQVVSIRNEEIDSSTEEDSTAGFHCTVSVRNRGDGYFPVDVLIRFENGDWEVKPWDGQKAYFQFRFPSVSRVQFVHVDPNRVNLLDLNLANNSQSTETTTAGIWRYTLRILFWIQSVFSILSMAA